MPEQRYSANDLSKDFMINHMESDLHRPGIIPGLANSQSNTLLNELTRRFQSLCACIGFYFTAVWLTNIQVRMSDVTFYWGYMILISIGLKPSLSWMRVIWVYRPLKGLQKKKGEDHLMESVRYIGLKEF
jgi:hypothetical protein